VADVHVAPEAERDITEIFAYLLAVEGLEAARRLVGALDEAIRSLSALPRRGKCPPEFQAEGITLFREIQCYPWRIFYRIVDENVWVLSVLDGRRNIAHLLPERLIRQVS
jgi:toxin ParE1/3/4